MKWFDLFKPKKKPKESKFVTVANRYKNFKLSRLNKVFSSDMSILQVHVCKNNIESYTIYLKKLKDAVENDRSVPSLYFERDIKTVYLRDFFISEKGNFTDQKKTMLEFSEAATAFLELYDSKEKELDKTFELERNLRFVSPVVSNLCSLLEEFPNP